MKNPPPGQLVLLEVIAYLPGQEPRRVVADDIVEWNPGMGGLSYRKKDEREKIYSLLGCAFEVVFQESRVARIA